jgi:hypothetical protein
VTLSLNEMTVVEHCCDLHDMLDEGMALCAEVNHDDDGDLVGEPTEMGVVVYSMSIGVNEYEPLISEPESRRCSV